MQRRMGSEGAAVGNIVTSVPLDLSGDAVGEKVDVIGESVGKADGVCVGIEVNGISVGNVEDGDDVGCGVDGDMVGATVVGDRVVGESVGLSVVGMWVGKAVVGILVGTVEGVMVGMDIVGVREGLAVGGGVQAVFGKAFRKLWTEYSEPPEGGNSYLSSV